jgi:hypothetical protein
MQFNHLLHLGRLLAAGAAVVVLSLTAGCQTMTPLFSPPEPSVEYPTTSSSAYQFYGDKQCKTKSDSTRPGVSNGSKPTSPGPLSIPAAPRIERAITAPRPPALAVSPGTPKSTGKGH